MRQMMDVLVALMLAGLLAGAVMYTHHGRSQTAMKDRARDELRRFQQQISLQTALEQTELNDAGFPATVDPAWFNGALPANPLLSTSHPWVEVADSSQRAQAHPTDVVPRDGKSARFWYNPYRGIVRARVPAGISDTATLDIYNHVNEVALDDLYPSAERH
jgi:type II secretory pathway pseudopilin PulG